MSYEIVSAETAAELAAAVTALIVIGAVCVGGVFVVPFVADGPAERFYQAVLNP